MKGDRILYAGAAAVPSLGVGITAYTHGFDVAALAIGAPGAAFLGVVTVVAVAVLLHIVYSQIRPLVERATPSWPGGE